jgi:hypothetical protein
VQRPDHQVATGESIVQSRRRQAFTGVAEKPIVKGAEQPKGCRGDDLEPVVLDIQGDAVVVGGRRRRQAQEPKASGKARSRSLLKTQQIGPISLDQTRKFPLGARLPQVVADQRDGLRGDRSDGDLPDAASGTQLDSRDFRAVSSMIFATSWTGSFRYRACARTDWIAAVCFGSRSGLEMESVSVS